MQRIGIRELRQHASVWIRRVEAGESFEITDRGRPVAMLVPPPTGGEVERLLAAGRLRPAAVDHLDLDALVPPRPDQPLPSRLLEEARADER